MIDYPMTCKQPATVQEYVVENLIQETANLYALAETDLSFYDSLGAGFCSGSGSSNGPKREWMAPRGNT